MPSPKKFFALQQIEEDSANAHAAELDQLTVSREAAKEAYEGYFQIITIREDTELELGDSLDPFSEGIVFSAIPLKKSRKNICNLSGGGNGNGNTTISLAFVFAPHHFKPTPLYVMDEIDGRLDLRNVHIVANYIKKETKNVQLIFIRLRYNMFELEDRCWVFIKLQTKDTPKSITINPNS
ncbi:RecF/RecN/SMC N terminal domain-containing protein [Cladochytrium replicatum]|nr:RecF/RecN/SMC N terminal domain-containing protein [Cladochytrium replicatum]